MQKLRLRKNISPVATPTIRASALWEIQEIPGLMLRRIDYLAGPHAPKGWRLQIDPFDEHIVRSTPQMYQIWNMLKDQEFRTRSDLLDAVRAAGTYLESAPPEVRPLPF